LNGTIVRRADTQEGRDRAEFEKSDSRQLDEVRRRFVIAANSGMVNPWVDHPLTPSTDLARLTRAQAG